MSNANLRSITNNFMDARLLSLASWRLVSDILPRDRGGPYAVMQDGYDPEDPKMEPEEFILSRSGKWLPFRYLFLLPIPKRRTEFVFATAAEVMRLMYDLPSKVEIIRDQPESQGVEGAPESDEMVAAIRAAKAEAAGAAPHLSW